MSNRQLLPLWALSGVAIMHCLGGCQAEDSAPAPIAAVKPVEVTVTTPKTLAVSRLIELPAEIQPAQEAVLYGKTAGYLQRILVDKGDNVQAGQLLAVIQTPETLEDKAQAENNYQSEVFKAQSSVSSQSASTEKIGRSQAAVNQAKAEYLKALSNVKRSQSLLVEAQEAEKQSEQENKQADSALVGSRAEVVQAQADIRAAKSERLVSDANYQRLKQIHDRNAQLIALQDVESAKASADVALSKQTAAESRLVVVQQHVIQAQAQQRIAQSKVRRAKAQVATADSEIAMAKNDTQIQQEHLSSARHDVAVSQQESNVAAANVGQTQSAANAASSAAKKAATLSGYANVTAPFRGTITKRFVDVGAFIQTASTTPTAAAIVTLSDLSSVRFYLNIPESEASFVRVGTEVRFTLTTGKKEVLKGKVSRTSSVLESRSRTLLAEVDYPNTDHRILPGSYALGKVVLETHPNVLSLPSKAVGTEKSGRFVWVIASGKAKHLSVKTGFDDGTNIEIKEGFKGGEQVVADKLDAITPGLTVQAKH